MKYKHCPFCGDPPNIYTRMDESLFSHNIVQWTTVSCSNCDIQMNSEDEEDLVGRWNTRRKKKTNHGKEGD
jgi:Lar family restriction alleviation protein